LVLPDTAATLIREAREDDLPRLLELLTQLSQDGERPEAAVPPVGAAHRAALHAMRADSRITLLVLEVEGRVVGTLTLYVLPGLAHGARPAAIVEHVVVEAGLRGRGYGQQLMAHAEALARAHGCSKVALTSNRRRTAAHRFYDRLGYARTHIGFSKYDDG
jgi:GNAT superfamily N-acetyltransferase